jgi:hypothetical protein
MLHVAFLLDTPFDSEDGDDMFIQKISFTFNGLHGAMSQKTELFATTGVGTLNHNLTVCHPLQMISLAPSPVNIAANLPCSCVRGIFWIV